MPASPPTAVDMTRTRVFAVPTALSLALIALAGLTSTPHIARAQNTIKIYRCTDAAGAVTLQNNAPCAKGSRQEIREVGSVLSAPPPAATSAAPASRAAPPPGSNFELVRGPQETTPATSAPIMRTPPPALYQCRSWDDRDYLGDVAEPPATCAPLETVGIDGTSSLAAGSACEMRRDTCEAIPPERLCAAWKKRLDEAEFRWKFAGSGNDARKTEFERVRGVWLGSTCAGG